MLQSGPIGTVYCVHVILILVVVVCCTNLFCGQSKITFSFRICFLFF